VTTPTLTGLGERAHLGSAGATLSTHIDDVVEHLWFEDLNDAVLVGWSYGVFPIEGAADRIPERIRAVVSLDGPLVRDGLPMEEPPEAEAASNDTGLDPPPTAADFAGVIDSPSLREFIAARERPHAVATFLTPFPNTGGRRWQLPHVYLACTQPLGESFSRNRLDELEEIAADPRWELRKLALNHLGPLYAPDVVADALVEVVNALTR
jgi:pimeloyl-ACP methyl ester carboxylesterase